MRTLPKQKLFLLKGSQWYMSTSIVGIVLISHAGELIFITIHLDLPQIIVQPVLISWTHGSSSCGVTLLVQIIATKLPPPGFLLRFLRRWRRRRSLPRPRERDQRRKVLRFFVHQEAVDRPRGPLRPPLVMLPHWGRHRQVNWRWRSNPRPSSHCRGSLPRPRERD